MTNTVAITRMTNSQLLMSNIGDLVPPALELGCQCAAGSALSWLPAGSS
jgi:hypothetical protein